MALPLIEHLNRSSWGTTAVSVLVCIGLIEAAKAVYRLAAGVFVYYLRPGKSLKRLGTWAVVTGATDGIGRAYADALAQKGFNILLVSRTREKLDAAAAEITSRHGVKAEVVAADFARADKATWAELTDALAPLDVGVLVNNVGLSYDHASYLDELDEQRLADLIAVNITATTRMTKLVLPIMRKKKRGAIVNIGSAAATIVPSGPFYAVYAASKAYVDMFSKSMASECGPLGISVQNQAPMFVTTKMSKMRHASMTVPTPQTWVRTAIEHIGFEATGSPYWSHAIMWAALSSLPEWVNTSLLYKHGWDMRRRYLKKLARESKAQ